MIDLDKLLALDKPETKCRMLDYLFDKVDDQLYTENWDPVHTFLKEIDLDPTRSRNLINHKATR